MKDLIARLEAATEGSRELDAEIELSRRKFLGLIVGGAVVTIQPGGWLAGPGTGDQPVLAPHYTTSVDAALTLIPKGWRMERLHEGPEGAVAVLTPDVERTRRDETGVSLANGAGCIPLALCIATLKAREAGSE